MDKVNYCWILLVLCCLFSEARTQHNVIRFTTDEIKEIVDTHNDLRRSIYNAANMRELTWNEAVALAASEWGSRCEYVSRPDNQWGQNMNYIYGKDYHKSSLELFRDTFHGWSNETRHYDYRRYRYCGSKNVCSYVQGGRLRQLIAADVQEVGCAIVKCPKLELTAPRAVQRHAKIFVCFYTPWVNILGSEVFIPDKRCAACPQGTTCVDNLCSARFFQPGARTLPIGSSSVKIESISGSKASGTGVQHAPSAISISGGSVSNAREEATRHTGRGSGGERTRGGSHRNRGRGGRNRVIGSHNSFRNPVQNEHENNRVYQEYRSNNETIVVYTPNNRVLPFPGKTDKKNIRRIEKFERNVEKDLDEKQAKLIHSLELVASNITVVEASKHKGNRSDLTGEEQFFTISAHNLLRREVGAKDLAWSSYLERWAKYVIRCETEYPGPIKCYTNFGKAERGQDIYNVVYQWGAEGEDLTRPLRYGCRTPYDRTLCNHNTIIRNKSLTQMACASKHCGSQRQLTCIYSSG
ncbi:uncharacterized protein LOC128555276 isoform X4 [Mercenaria mercenaria]|uniref:uncharacterized protein LOC128555276 isoform X4 n=1 Tax=Mercenaria mercenaria TaxID=6596 RepID=UPI00234F6FD4|nr:uncharacterized protein LOC128555276 isoform X4 [Mercenaria mercenaria]